MANLLITELTDWIADQRKNAEMAAQLCANRYAETNDPDHKQDFKRYQALAFQMEAVQSKVSNVLNQLDHLFPKENVAE